MKEKLSQIYNGILGSFSNDTTGYSGKKLSAFAIVTCMVAAHIKWLSMGDFSQLVTVLIADGSFVCALFGINTYDKKVNPMEQHDPNKPTP